MSYQVLARKWRPQIFTTIVGQEHVVKSLVNALQHDRLHHAYLFTGTRGVGKTTIARILAKAMNCENLQEFNPCGECSVCQAFSAGRFLDLIEVDAASRTKVEDTRDLLDNAQYAPSQGQYKVYLIDEVHMLSGHSFNALLKTLEEPPPHVKFLLATTDPQKIPVTILSRCMQFNLKRLLPQQISTQMHKILEQEQVDFDEPALRLLARAADGSMRDGLSLLDQAIVFGSGKVNTEIVGDMLGTVAQQPVEDLLRALGDNDAVKILDMIAEISELTPNFADLLQQMLEVLHQIALVQTVANALDQDENADMIKDLASSFSKEDVQLYYQIALKGQVDLDLAPDPRSGFEMLILRMLAFRPQSVEQSQHTQKPKQSEKKQLEPKKKANTEADIQPQAKPAHSNKNDWPEMIQAMKLRGMTRELANNCVLEAIDEKTCVLLLDPGHKQLKSEKTAEKLQQSLQTYTGNAIKLAIQVEKVENETPAVQINKQREEKQKAAVDAIENDENVRALKEHFDARVIPGSISPVDRK
ncbi:MAG: DNA polymerase III subunit gamma/tau [Methylococcaceae bacterium]